jgi:hypothetical protein
MFTSVGAWVKAHATAILATVIAVSKAGLLGKAVSSIVTTLAVVIAGTAN